MKKKNMKQSEKFQKNHRNRGKMDIANTYIQGHFPGLVQALQ